MRRRGGNKTLTGVLIDRLIMQKRREIQCLEGEFVFRKAEYSSSRYIRDLPVTPDENKSCGCWCLRWKWLAVAHWCLFLALGDLVRPTWQLFWYFALSWLGWAKAYWTRITSSEGGWKCIALQDWPIGKSVTFCYLTWFGRAWSYSDRFLAHGGGKSWSAADPCAETR